MLIISSFLPRMNFLNRLQTILNISLFVNRMGKSLKFKYFFKKFSIKQIITYPFNDIFILMMELYKNLIILLIFFNLNVFNLRSKVSVPFKVTLLMRSFSFNSISKQIYLQMDLLEVLCKVIEQTTAQPHFVDTSEIIHKYVSVLNTVIIKFFKFIT